MHLNPHRQRFRPTAQHLTVALLVALICGSYSHSALASVSEAKVRAAMIVGILRYTRWDTPDEHRQYTLCTLSRSATADELNRARDKIRIDQKVIQLIDIQNKAQTHCDVIISSPNTAEAQLLASANPHTLLICDGCERPNDHSAIRLIRHKQRIGFDINISKAAAAGIQFSSALLELARSLENTP